MIVRSATSHDADGMSVILGHIIQMWNSDRSYSAEHTRSHYINHADNIRCSVALLENERIAGFQALKYASAGNGYGVTPGWGIIGTYVDLEICRKGIGSALFASSLGAAQHAGLPYIDATIGTSNSKGLAYYDTMGFVNYKVLPAAIGKRYQVPDI